MELHPARLMLSKGGMAARAGLITMLVVTPLTQKSDPPTELLDGDGNKVELKDRLGTLPLFRRVD